MSDLGFRPGDRVRVHTEYEGTVDWMDPHRYAVKDDDGNLRRVARTYRGTEVTKVEPPAEQFKPGVVLRRKTDGHIVVPLETGGWVNVTRGGRRYGPDFEFGGFTSKGYERVNI